MCGYNLDHGTDLGTFVDEIPVNEPSHAHDQGYTDLNFLIPELADNIHFTKGTFALAECWTVGYSDIDCSRANLRSGGSR
jgi:hypothetical protein